MSFKASEDEKRILIVEDDDLIRDLIQESLRDKGYELSAVSTALEAMNRIPVFKPHLVITDNDMPGMTGIEMLRELRTEENYVTVIFVSGISEAKFIVQAFEAGADDYIRKPFKMSELAARVTNSLRNNDLHRDLLAANQRLLEMVDRDYLTGLYNMRSMFDKMGYELKRAKRFKRPIACVMLDMDYFKLVNDGNDHLFGSFVLNQVGHIIQENIREIDFAARYGGDEFLIILSETDSKGGHIFCERLRSAVETHHFKDRGSEIDLTVSIGFAISDGEEIDPKEFMLKADKALYVSKDRGRNQVNEYKRE